MDITEVNGISDLCGLLGDCHEPISWEQLQEILNGESDPKEVLKGVSSFLFGHGLFAQICDAISDHLPGDDPSQDPSEEPSDGNSTPPVDIHDIFETHVSSFFEPIVTRFEDAINDASTTPPTPPPITENLFLDIISGIFSNDALGNLLVEHFTPPVT